MKEKIAQLVSDFGWKLVKVEEDRNATHKGVAAREFNLTFDRPGGRYKTTHIFAKGNGMSEDNMITVMGSYLKNEDRFRSLAREDG
jgi:hypothetical protein